MVAEPIIQSTWMRLVFAPLAARASGACWSPSMMQVSYAWPSAMWLAAFSSKRVFQKRIPLAAMGEEESEMI